MKITKLGHCCLVIEEKGLRILTDPGAWTTAQNEQKNIDLILITHEHPDHLHVDSIKTVLKNNPHACIYTNSGVGKILNKENITYTLLEDQNCISVNPVRNSSGRLKPAGIVLKCNHAAEQGDSISNGVKGVTIEGHGKKHAYIYKTVPEVINTGYLIGGRFFYPGDAFYNPKKPIEILALPVSGPWMRIADALEYALEIKPRKAFPVHDGMFKIFGPFHLLPQKILSSSGIDFVIPELGEEMDFE